MHNLHDSHRFHPKGMDALSAYIQMPITAQRRYDAKRLRVQRGYAARCAALALIAEHGVYAESCAKDAQVMAWLRHIRTQRLGGK